MSDGYIFQTIIFGICMLHVWYLYVKLFRVCKNFVGAFVFLAVGTMWEMANSWKEGGTPWEKMHRNKCNVFVLENTLKMDDH